MIKWEHEVGDKGPSKVQVVLFIALISCIVSVYPIIKAGIGSSSTTVSTKAMSNPQSIGEAYVRKIEKANPGVDARIKKIVNGKYLNIVNIHIEWNKHSVGWTECTVIQLEEDEDGVWQEYTPTNGWGWSD